MGAIVERMLSSSASSGVWVLTIGTDGIDIYFVNLVFIWYDYVGMSL